MSRIFDNIDQDLLTALRATLDVSKRADFCVGYLNLRGWQAIDSHINAWEPTVGQVCRVLVGMQRPAHEEIRELYRQTEMSGVLDNATASRLKTQFAAHLREQITLGIPTGRDEAGLRVLARQLRAGQVGVKLFLPYPLHAKLYLLFRDDANNPITGFVGSSNLTLAGLSRHGELNVDVLDHLGTEKLSKWFDARFNTFVFDWLIRQSVTSHVSFSFLYNTLVPRLLHNDLLLMPIANRAARLVCINSEFDDLAKSVGLNGHQDGATDTIERNRLRAELDGLIAHLYGLSEAEFVHILGAFPLVPQPTKVAAHNAYRDVEKGLIK
ncbi:MAG: hypothetical protein H7346_13015 [Burkholderiaceae bacterium]|nr:hypothetical protein [Burkholderiaceae bacterium]